MKKQEKHQKCRIIPTCAAWSECGGKPAKLNSTVLILVPSATCFKLSEALGTNDGNKFMSYIHEMEK